MRFFWLFKFFKLGSHKAAHGGADFCVVMHSVMSSSFNLVYLRQLRFFTSFRLENALKLIFYIKCLNVFIISELWIQTSLLKLPKLRQKANHLLVKLVTGQLIKNI
jgi:hypothetical protein|tara:strand:- start:1487 stop:1804 length:318 start_codon:yes stop_codon:yes gene_type:complete